MASNGKIVAKILQKNKARWTNVEDRPWLHAKWNILATFLQSVSIARYAESCIGATENARNDNALTGADNARIFWIDGHDKFWLYFASVFASGLLLFNFFSLIYFLSM